SSSSSSSVSSNSSRISSSSSSLSSSARSVQPEGQQCNWHGTLYPSCADTQSGWGWEDSASCVGPDPCSGQPDPYGIVGGGNSSSVSSIASSSSSSSLTGSSSSSTGAVSG